MSTIKIFVWQFMLASFFSFVQLVVAQDNRKLPELPVRPKFTTNVRTINVPAVDNVVMQSFSLLKSVDEVGARVGVIESQLKAGIPDLTLTLSQVNECTGALTTIGSASPALAEGLVNMIGNIKDLHVPVFKIPLALKNLNEARKAVQYCIAYTKYLGFTAIPGIKQKIKSGGQGDQVKN